MQYSLALSTFQTPPHVSTFTGLSIGSVVRIGQELPTNPQRAKLIASWSLTLIFLVGCFVAIVVYLARDFVVGLFTNDPDVFTATRDIWPFVCLHLIAEYMFGLQAAVMRALALQWRMAVCLTACLWGFLLPTVFWKAVVRSGGLLSLWTLLPTGYTCMNVVMRLSYAYVSWDDKSSEAKRKLQDRSSAFVDTALTEKESLLQHGESVVST